MSKRKATATELQNNIRNLKRAIQIFRKKANLCTLNSETYVHVAWGDMLFICAELEKLIQYESRELKGMQKSI